MLFGRQMVHTGRCCSCTCTLSVSFYRSLPDDYDGQLYKAHCEVLYTTLLIHLDDSSEQIKVIDWLTVCCKARKLKCVVSAKHSKQFHVT